MAVRTSIGLIFESRFSKWFGVSVVRRGWSSDLLTGVTIGLISALVTPQYFPTSFAKLAPSAFGRGDFFGIYILNCTNIKTLAF